MRAVAAVTNSFERVVAWCRDPSGAQAALARVRTWGPAAEADAYRWERERGTFLKEGGKAGASRRRRSQQLLSRAYRNQRAGIGVGRSEVADDPVPPLWRRFTADSDADEAFRRWVVMALVGGVGGVLVGPGLAAGRWALYEQLDRRSPRIGRLWAWPWLVAAAVVGIVLWLCGLLTVGAGLHLIPYLPLVWVDLSWFELVVSWASWQAVIALVATAWWVRAWGWAAVPEGAVVAPKQLADGTWRETPDEEKLDVGFDLSAYEAYEPPAHYDDDGVDDDQIPEEDR